MAERSIKTRQRQSAGRVSVSIYLTKEMAQRLDTHAEYQNRSRSDIVRQLIEAALQPPQREREAS